MKAVIINEFGGPEVLETVDLAEESPSVNEVKIKLYAAGLNPNESYTIAGTYGPVKPDLPYVPGFDGAGIIEEVGSGVEALEQGDRVFFYGYLADKNTGTYAEKVIASADRVFPLPKKLSLIEGAALGIPAFTAYRVLFHRAKIKAEDTVLIHGASGAVGNFSLQIAKAVGAKVIGTSSSEAGREEILKAGADYALNHLSEDNQEELLEITEGKGPDVILEMLANKNLEFDTKIINKFGRIVVVGNRGRLEFNPSNLMKNEANITSVNVGYMTAEDFDTAMLGILDMIEKDKLRPLVGEKFTLDQTKEAHQHLIDGPGNGRTVFVMAEE